MLREYNYYGAPYPRLNHYPLPDVRLLPNNGSYHHMGSRDISRIYMRCYGHKLNIRQWGEYDEGRFYSRFDKYPYWCRDMLAYRAALSNCTPWINRSNKILVLLLQFTRKVEQFINDVSRKIRDAIHREFLDEDEFPPELRHLWGFHWTEIHR